MSAPNTAVVGTIEDFAGNPLSFAVPVGPNLLLAARPETADASERGFWVRMGIGSERTWNVRPIAGIHTSAFGIYRVMRPSLTLTPLQTRVNELPRSGQVQIQWDREGGIVGEAHEDEQKRILITATDAPNLSLLGAPVVYEGALCGVIVGKSERDYIARGLSEFLHEWHTLPAFQEFETELFWPVAPLIAAVKRTREAKPPAGPLPHFNEVMFSAGATNVLRWAVLISRKWESQVGARTLLAALLHHGELEETDSAGFLWKFVLNAARREKSTPLEWLRLGPKVQARASQLGGIAGVEAFERLSENARAWLQEAVECAEAIGGVRSVSLRYIVGALLLGTNARKHATAAQLLPRADAIWEDLGSEYQEFISQTFPEDRDAWRVWSESVAQSAPAAVPVRAIRTGYAADLPFGEDELGIEEEVGTLCSVMLDEGHPPPLSIGLFGDWGSGKSFFIGRMQRRIAQLTNESRRAREHGIPTSFVAHAPQIEFNAWHYIDANLWASLVTHLSSQLRLQLYGKMEERRRAQLEAALYENLQTTRRRVEDLQRDKSIADKLATQAQTHYSRAEQELRSGQSGFVRVISADPALLAGAVLESNVEVGAKAREIAAELGRAQARGAELQALVAEVLDEAGKWKRFYRDNRAICWAVLGAALLAAVLSIPPVAALIGDGLDEVVRWLKWLVALLAGAGAYFGRLRPYLAKARELRAIAEQLRTQILEEERQKIARAEREAGEAAERLAQEQRRARELEAKIEEARRGIGLDAFLQERLGSSQYKEQLGIVALARQDFEFLTKRLADGVTLVDERGQESVQRVDRVILYIDDLDRCPPDRVVEVLQAVHLLLGVPLFVVVLAADPRWLLHSLRKHYAELLATRGASRDQSQWESTPQQYLEKIFQIPFTLPPMEERGFRKLVKSLLARTTRAEKRVAPEIPLQAAQTKAAAAPEHETERSEPAELNAPAAQLAVQNVANVESEWKPSVDLAPEYLQLEDQEKAFLEELAPLVSTPRSAKRLINVYRLMRANLDETRRAQLQAGEYRAAQLLLAVLIGFPEQAPELFSRLRKAGDGHAPWSSSVRGTQVSPAIPSSGWESLLVALDAMQEHFPSRRDGLPPFIDWIDEVSRYSFSAGRLGGEPAAQPPRG